MIVFAAIHANKFRFAGFGLVVINPAGQRSKVRIALQLEFAFAPLSVQRHGVAYAQNPGIDSMKRRFVIASLGAGQQAAQRAAMAVDFTDPFALLAALQSLW
jgi:hypothetical protein